MADSLSLDNTLVSNLGIEIVELSDEKIVATMPVDERTQQPFGILHGGASVALAETVASIGTFFLIDQENENAVGLEINANHLRAVRSGKVKAIGTTYHRGRNTMVWDIKIVDEEEKLVCISRCTMAVIKRKK
ncbi:hotdog fold thioesterase [Chengkuizengella axinellae]|uniref:Hotdog fold thioesterase n=1 Tax=Chengkuizengella axinellae TaxID=3064388 RepID=A0ABT9J1E5_9BACL|nr:hotdog fold thioesterase [Chengkuizengella sp. 2205SS18-9]MDP5275441.1 hotdog fold thioesterase [Chengkuizengella sp. 2205SS18-9]